jgi:hypothetical protein
MPMLNVFDSDAFGVVQLTDAVNKMPFVPSRAGEVAFAGVNIGVSTTSIAVEEFNGTLSLIPTTPRGSPGVQNTTARRQLRQINIPHIQEDFAVYADEVQGVRNFGSETDVQTVQQLVNGKMIEVLARMDLTQENLRLGALLGQVRDADNTVLVDLFTAFGVTQEPPVDFNLDNPATELRTICQQIRRTMLRNLQMTAPGNMLVYAFCGDNFFDALLSHAAFNDVYRATERAERAMAGNFAFGSVEFGGIVFENYRGTDDASTTVGIPTDEVRLFPVGVPGLYREVYAPADYEETVNTIGLPRYARQVAMPNGKGRTVEAQTNPLPYCTRPRVLMRGVRT